MSKKPITLQAVREMVLKLPEDQRRAAFCAAVGHSNIVQMAEGTTFCSRCGTRHSPNTAATFLVGCARTRANVAHFKSLRWRDTYYAPSNPFRENF